MGSWIRWGESLKKLLCDSSSSCDRHQISSSSFRHRYQHRHLNKFQPPRRWNDVYQQCCSTNIHQLLYHRILLGRDLCLVQTNDHSRCDILSGEGLLMWADPVDSSMMSSFCLSHFNRFIPAIMLFWVTRLKNRIFGNSGSQKSLESTLIGSYLGALVNNKSAWDSALVNFRAHKP